MSRRGLLAVIDYHLERQKLVRGGKADPYGEAPAGFPLAPELPDDPKQNLRWEREYVGAYLSGNPLDYVAATSVAAGIRDSAPGRWIDVVGIVDDLDFRHTRKGTPWARFSVVDNSGPGRCFCFGKLAGQLGEGHLGRFRGQLVSRDEEVELKVDAFKLIEEY